MGHIENMFKQMIEKNADSDAQLASHNTSMRNLEVQMGQISQALNSRPKGVLPSEMVVNPKGENNTRHAIAITTRSVRGDNAPTSNQKQFLDDEQVVQEEDVPNNVVQPIDEVRIDIDDSVEETQEEVNLSRDHIIDIPESVVQKDKAPFPKPLPLNPQRLAKKNGENQLKKFIQMMKSLSIIGSAEFPKALCDIGVSINLMPYSVFKILGIGQPRPTSMRLQMVDRTMKRSLGVIEEVLVRADKFILPADFVIFDCDIDYEVSIILGRPFLATGKALCYVEAVEVTFHIGDEKVVFHV
ncbi:uncharacterized protein [Nicotiana sylvestris]|uniref:uncharacterized protein n=1 Tax=Nicotiana sylvestris TaxID=4096 RepID=UPI00388C393A